MNFIMIQENIVYIILSIPFLLFIILPTIITIPPYISNICISSLGIIILFSITLSLFLFTPLLFASLLLLTLYIFLKRYSNIESSKNIEITQLPKLPNDNNTNFNAKSLEENIILSAQENNLLYSTYN